MRRPLALRLRPQQGRTIGEYVVLIKRSPGVNSSDGYWEPVPLVEEEQRILRAATEPTTTVHRKQLSQGGIRQELDIDGERRMGQRTFLCNEIISPSATDRNGDVFGHPYEPNNEEWDWSQLLWYHTIRIERWRDFWIAVCILFEPQPLIDDKTALKRVNAGDVSWSIQAHIPSIVEWNFAIPEPSVT